MNLYVAKSMIMSPLDFSLRESECGLIYQYSLKDQWHQIFFTRSCTCRGKKNCVCSWQNLSCTNVCLCESSNNCNNEVTQQTRFHNFATVYEEEDIDEDLYMSVVCSLALHNSVLIDKHAVIKNLFSLINEN